MVVKDGTTVIPSSEYTVSYSNNIKVGTATVTITDNPDGNYDVRGSKTFTIQAGAASLKEPPRANDLTYNGFEQALVTPGTAVNGKVVYATTTKCRVTMAPAIRSPCQCLWRSNKSWPIPRSNWSWQAILFRTLVFRKNLP